MAKYGKTYWSKVSERYVPEHVFTWELFMQTEVPFDENGRRCHIHHVDGNKLNNDILNLMCMTESEHHRIENINKKFSVETRKKLSMKKIGNKNACGTDRKSKITDETRKRLSEAAKKQWQEKRRTINVI